MKHGDDNIMSTLQKKTWLTQDKYKTHREASIVYQYCIRSKTSRQSTRRQRPGEFRTNQRRNIHPLQDYQI